MKIAVSNGSGSQENKQKILPAMLTNDSKQERKYIVRLAASKMRLGVGDMTVLEALAEAFLGSKDANKVLEQAYNVSSDIGYIAKVLLKSGMAGIKRVRTAIDRAIKPMLAQRVSQFSEIKKKIGSIDVAVEEKYDGERIQAHKNGDNIKLFSRRLRCYRRVSRNC